MGVKDVHPGSPTRLSICLNYAIFKADYMFAIPDAIKICDKALSDSQDKIEEMNEEDFKESK